MRHHQQRTTKLFKNHNISWTSILKQITQNVSLTHDTKVEAAKWSDWFYRSYIFELELIHFCSTSFNAFWATFPNISHLDPKPRYNPWKVLMIRVMHVIPVVENEKICKPMVDHFHWNEFERNTYPSNTWESSVYFHKGLRI